MKARKPPIHPAIATEIGMIDQSVGLAEQALRLAKAGADAATVKANLTEARGLQRGAKNRVSARLAALDMYRQSSDILGRVLAGEQPAKELLIRAGKLTAAANKLTRK